LQGAATQPDLTGISIVGELHFNAAEGVCVHVFTQCRLSYTREKSRRQADDQEDLW